MDAIEILIIMGVAILVGFLIIGFIADWDYKNLSGSIRKRMTESEEGKIKVDKDTFAARLGEYSMYCRTQGKAQSKTYHVEGTGSFSKSDLFVIIKDLRWCESVQSAENGCGSREDIEMEPITLPRSVGLRCVDAITKVN